MPPFGRNAEELVARSLDPNSASAQLARVVLKDLGLTSQLLRVVNSPFYNHSGRRIMSVAHAITLLGWDTVRALVTGLRYVEQYANHSAGLRELMTLSLVTATHVRDAAVMVGYARPEEAYICGLFRNLGEVLVARYYAREYADVLLTVRRERVPVRAASIRVFGFDFNDVAPGVAESWNLPRSVCLSTGGNQIGGNPEQRCLVSLANYGHELTTSLYRNSEPLESVHLRTVETPDGRQVLIPQRDVRAIIDSAIEETRQTLAALQIPVAALRLEKQAEQARHVLENTAPPVLVCDTVGLDAAIRAATASLDAPTFDAGVCIQDLLEALTASATFERALFALMSEDGHSIRGRLACGPDPAQLLEAFQFSLKRGDPILHASVERKQDLWINRQLDPRFEGSRVFTALEPAHAAVYPVVVDSVVAGVLYADRKGSPPPLELRDPVDQIRNLIALALAKTRSGSQPSSPGKLGSL